MESERKNGKREEREDLEVREEIKQRNQKLTQKELREK